MKEYNNGWEGFTKKDWKEMTDVCSNKLPVWTTVYGGEHVFLAEETLRANGFHPDRIPKIFKTGKGTVSKLLKEIEKTIPLTYVPTPNS